MKFLLALNLLCLCHGIESMSSISKKSDYEEHKARFGLKYSVEEDHARKMNFDKADAIIKAHNADPKKTSKLAHNPLSTLHEHEKKQLRGAVIPKENRQKEKKTLPLKMKKSTTYQPTSNTTEVEEQAISVSEPSNLKHIRKRREAYPKSLDWRSYKGTNYLAPIQNQGKCGSCWTFSATASLESRWAFVNKKPVPKLSEQNIVDCCHTGSSDGNNCNGGWYTDAWNYVASNKGFSVGPITGTNKAALPKPHMGQDYLSTYPYTGKGGQKCKFSGNSIGGTSWSYKTPGQQYKRSASYNIKPNSPAAFKKALQSGPISVAIDASGDKFSYYKKGILQASDCGIKLDHAVNVIGYGSDADGDFWLMRNSWGTDWGLQGYMKFQRTDKEGSPGTCGLLQAAAYPNVVKDK